MAIGRPDRVRVGHLVEEQSLCVDVSRELASPGLLDRVAEINRRRFAAVLAQVLDEFDAPDALVRIDRISVTLGSFTPEAMASAADVLRDRLRAALADALRFSGRATLGRADRALVDAFEHYLLHGTWPAARALSLALRPADMLAQLVAEDPLALVAMLRRRGSSDALLRRLVRQIPERLLAALLQRLEPVHAAYVLSYLDEVRESHAAERLISANPAELAEMLWTIVLRDALQQSGLQANRKAFLRRLLLQLARSGGTTLAALIAQLRRGLPRVLARRRAPGSLVAILSELIAEEPALLTGQGRVAELAALLRRDRLPPREQQHARRLIEAVDARPLRWLLHRLARDEPVRLRTALAKLLPRSEVHGTIPNSEEAGLSAALEAISAGGTERTALLALLARPRADSGTVTQPQAALTAGKHKGVPEQLGRALKEVPPEHRREPTCKLLAAALAEAADFPSTAVLARIRRQFGRARAVDPFGTRQILRDFAAVDASRLCALLGADDAPAEIVRHLLAPHLHAALTALARAARCSSAEWDCLLAIAATTQDEDPPETLLTAAIRELARARQVSDGQLYAEMRAERARMTGADRAALAALCLPPRRHIDQLGRRQTALEQLTFLLDADAPLDSEQRAAAIVELLPQLSGAAAAVLRARLFADRDSGKTLRATLLAMPRSALDRIALLLSIPTVELRRMSPADLPAAIIAKVAAQGGGAAKIWGSRQAPAGSRRAGSERTVAALIKARPFAALQLIAQREGAPGEPLIRLEKRDMAPLLFAAMAPAERDRASALLRLLTSRKGRRAIAPARLGRALALAAAARDWRSCGGSGFAAEWVRQLMALASLAEQAALRQLLGGTDTKKQPYVAAADQPGTDTRNLSISAKARALLGLRASGSSTALRRSLEQVRNRQKLTRELSEAELVQLLALLAPTAADGLLHAAERLSAARRACAAPLTRALQWDGILTAAASSRPIPQLTSLFLDGAEAIPAPPAPLRRQIAASLLASLEGMRDAPLRIALDLRECEQKRRAIDARLKDSDEMPSVLHIANAGLVLASAFLPRLFQSLDYVAPDECGGWRWYDGDSQMRAVRLLQWLVDERTDTPEPQLALNKILCGLALAEPVPAEIAFTESELRMAATLLRTMLASWPPLTESGVAALRETFLQREGRLTHNEAGWRLAVENRVLDVLIDQLPWGFSTILHPWIPAPLTVEWR